MNSPDYTFEEDDKRKIHRRVRTNCFFIERHLSRQFSNLGCLIARHPFYFTLLPVLVSVILSTGFLRLKFNRDLDYLMAATDSKALQAKLLVQTLFPMNTSEFFDYPRLTMASEFMMVAILAKDDGSMLRQDVFQEVQYLDEMIKNETVEVNGNSINYANVCGRRMGKCVDNADIVQWATHLKEIRNGRYNIHYPVYINNLTFSYKEYVQSIGGVEVDDSGYLRDAKAIRLSYALDVTDKNKIQEIHEWQISVLKLLKQAQFNRIKISFYSEDVLKEEIKKYTEDMLKIAPIVVSTLVLFSFVTSMATDCVRSKPWLGPLSCVSTGLAIASTVGFLCHFGVEYIDFSILLFFTVLANEIDDAFILIASWRITDPKDSVEERMKQTFSQSAASITITSLTTVLSFSIGISSTVPAVRISCIYGTCCCFFAYIYLITFFGGCMAFSGYREEKRLHPFTFCRIKENSSKEESSYFLMLLLSKAFESLLLHKSFKILIAVLFIALLAIGIRGVKTIHSGSEITDVMSTNSSTQQMVLQMQKYFGKYTSPVHIMIKDYMNYADPSVQESIEGLLNNFTSYKHIAEPLLEMSWLKHYKLFQSIPMGKIMLKPFNMSNERDFVFALKHIFLKFPQTRPYVDDIRFNEDHTKILSSRFILLAKDVYSPEIESTVAKDLYNIAEKSSIPVELFSLAFHVIESSFSVPARTAELAAVCCSLVCVVFILFAPNIPYALCISAVVLSSIVEVIGFLSFWHVKLDYITLITFSYSIGLCINYPSHMTFALLVENQKASNNVKRSALYILAYPISQGCLSTILGLTTITLHPHYISQTAFKTICCISFLSAYHALFTIPVIFNTIGNYFGSFSVKNSDLQMKRQRTFEKSLLDEDNNENK